MSNFLVSILNSLLDELLLLADSQGGLSIDALDLPLDQSYIKGMRGIQCSESLPEASARLVTNFASIHLATIWSTFGSEPEICGQHPKSASGPLATILSQKPKSRSDPERT